MSWAPKAIDLSRLAWATPFDITALAVMGGALASLDATDLGGKAIAAALDRAEVARAR
jgi:hypothetical protein